MGKSKHHLENFVNVVRNVLKHVNKYELEMETKARIFTFTVSRAKNRSRTIMYF